MTFEAVQLRSRWHTPQLQSIRKALVTALRARDATWPLLLPEALRARSAQERDDLRGISFDGENLCEADLSYTDLSWASIRNCSMRQVILQGALAVGADFSGSSMAAADLLELNAANAKFVRSDLAAAILIGGQFMNADFSFASLRSAILDEADFSGAKLWQTVLLHAEVARAKRIDLSDPPPQTGRKENFLFVSGKTAMRQTIAKNRHWVQSSRLYNEQAQFRNLSEAVTRAIQELKDDPSNAANQIEWLLNNALRQFYSMQSAKSDPADIKSPKGLETE